MRRTYLFITVFVSGMAALAVEMTASRLVGDTFGASNLVWATIIGLILIYLTLGYFLGGQWADRSPHPQTFFSILCWGAFTIGLIPLASQPLELFARSAFDQLRMGDLLGTFLVILVVFSIPVTLIGTASPFALRLLIRDQSEAGRTSGQISAASTLGSFIGTFLPVLILIPTFGTHRTFGVLALLLLSVALVGLGLLASWRRALLYAWMPLVLLLVLIFGPRLWPQPEGIVYQDESAYNFIQVLQIDDYHILRLNEGQGMHSIYHPIHLGYNGPWEQVLAGPFWNAAPYAPDSVRRIAIVGLAAGTTARQATAVFGEDVIIDGYEIDPQIIEVGRDYFGMTMPNLNVFAQDGRWGLAQSRETYSIISVDAYRPPYIPWHMTTREFFLDAYNHLSADGVLVINVGRAEDDRRLIDAISSTLATIFPSVHVIDLPLTFNSIVYATVQPTEAASLRANYEALRATPGTHPLLLAALEIALANPQPTITTAQVFTDDWAPIEGITNSMVLRYFLTGAVEIP